MAKNQEQHQPIFKLRARRYPCPPGLSVSSFVMRQLDGEDDVEAAMAADVRAGSAAPQDTSARNIIDVRERIRRSLVRVNDRAVNVGGEPYGGIDHWSLATIRFAERAFVELNLVKEETANAFFTKAEDVDLDANGASASAPSSA